MCTVTIVPAPAGWRLACNRDEQRDRPAALPPQTRRIAPHTAIMPIDPDTNGTWIAVNDTGLAMTLLNVNPATEPEHNRSSNKPNLSCGLNSRGIIIPSLVHCDTVEAAMTPVSQIDPASYPPFRLVLIDGQNVAECRSNGEKLHIQHRTFDATPLMYTSSGLGDHLVEQPRRELFDQFFSDATSKNDPFTRQEAYHRHSWSQRLHLSVCMRRPDAHTVSYTIIDVSKQSVSLTYYGNAPDEPTQPVSTQLNREATIAS